jgi:hypothetical protein
LVSTKQTLLLNSDSDVVEVQSMGMGLGVEVTTITPFEPLSDVEGAVVTSPQTISRSHGLLMMDFSGSGACVVAETTAHSSLIL